MCGMFLLGIFLALWIILILITNFNIAVIFLGIIILAGVANGVMKFKGNAYLADKYDKEKRNNKR